MADKPVTAEPPAAPVYISTNRQDLIRVGVLGLAVGIITPLLGWLLANYFIAPIFCNSPETFSICSSGGLTAYYIASVLVAIGAVALLANWAVYRPLLIAVGALVALWGLKRYVDPLTEGNWLEYYTYSALLYAAAYLAFYWLLRIRNFAVSLVVAIVAVALVRWALVA